LVLAQILLGKVVKGPEIANRQMVKRDFFIGKKIPPTPFIPGRASRSGAGKGA
jgi:hypothetical protein